MEVTRDYSLYEGNALRQPQALPSLPEEQIQTSQAEQVLVVREKLAVSPFALVGIAVVAILLALAIASQLRLYAVQSTNGELQDQLEELEETHARLQSSYESNYDLSRVETYALTQLGMHQAQGSEVRYVDLSGQDEAVVLAPTATQEASMVLTTFRESFGYLLDTLKSFFGKA